LELRHPASGTIRSTSADTPDYPYYKAAISDKRLPLAFVDMDLLDINAQSLSRRAGSLPMRIATKSVRCAAIMRYILDRYPSFRGLMAFSAAEADFLVRQGFDDILIGYPTMELSEIQQCLPHIQQGSRIIFMVDDVRQAEILHKIAKQNQCIISICIDVDLSTKLPFLNFGVLRSSIRSWQDMSVLLESLKTLDHLHLMSVMGYEGQLAGIADALPGLGLYNLIIRILKSISQKECFARRQEIVGKLQADGFQLEFVNGGGTGSIEETKQDPSVTELTVGSGLFSPALFDHYRSFCHKPALAFVLPVVRQARKDVYACSGGGYIASGPIHSDKEPKPYLPVGLKLIKSLGAGEVQTSVRSPYTLNLGDPLFFRHAKAGELCERFTELYLLRAGSLEDQVPTYRGQGACFF